MAVLNRISCGTAVLLFGVVLLAIGVRREVVECARAEDVCRISVDHVVFRSVESLKISDIAEYTYQPRSKARGAIALVDRDGRERVVSVDHDVVTLARYDRLHAFMTGEGERLQLVTGRSKAAMWAGLLFIVLCPLGFLRGWGRR